MSENTEQTSNSDNAMTELDLTSNETNSETQQNSSTLIKSLLAICLIGLIGLAAALYYIMEQGKQKLASLGTNIEASVDSRLQEIENIKLQIEELTTTEEQQLDTIEQLQSSQSVLQDSLTALSQERPDSNFDWALAEVEHLIIIALQKVQLAKDPETAAIALESADARLKDFANPDLLLVREQLTKDINNLKAINQIDTAGMSLYLSDLISKVDSLPIKDSLGPVDYNQESETDANQSEANNWQEKISQLPELIWQELKTMVVVKHNDETGKAFLLPEQEYYLYQNLRLQLESAKFAVLAHDTANLQNNLQTITSWLEQHFKTSDASIANIIEALDKMKTVDLQPELPDISSSLETLRAVMHANQSQEDY